MRIVIKYVKWLMLIFSVMMLSTFLLDLNGGIKVTLAETSQNSGTYIIRVYFDDQETAHSIASWIEPLESKYEKGYLLLEVSDREYDRLVEAGLRVEIDEAIVAQFADLMQAELYNIPGYECYRTVEETFATAESIVSSYPDLATWTDVGDSWEKTQGFGGYDIMVLRLTNSTLAGPKPKIFMTAAIHGREYTTAELLTRLAEFLVDNYGSDADTTWLLDYHEVHLMLHTNPDGRKKAESGLLWRKNTNQNYCGTTSNNRGADLNRNFPFKWNCCDGSIDDPCNLSFHGSGPASEPETQAVRDYIVAQFPDQRGPADNEPAPQDAAGIYLDLHSSGRLVLWPWSWTADPPPNGTQLQTLGRKLAFFNDHTPQQGIAFYPTDGTTKLFAYGEMGLAAYTIELGTEFFEPCSYFEDTLVPDNLPSLIYAIKVARTPYMTPAGPDALHLTLSSGSTEPGVFSGTLVSLSATINDTRYNNSNGTESTQNIAAAEFYVDVPPWLNPPDRIPISMSPSDGVFNSTVEAVDAIIDTTGWTDGQHTLFIRGQDGNGNWGAFSAIFLYIENIPCSDDNECNDGVFCNGLETCADGFCRMGIDPCPGLECNETNDQCLTNPVERTVGNTFIFPQVTTNGNRRAMPYTMPESGTIQSITMYHQGGNGNMLLGVYADDGQGKPGSRLGVTEQTEVSTIEGWQTVDIVTPVFVPIGMHIWLAWAYEDNPGIRYQSGAPGRAQSNETWDGGMPTSYGPSSESNYIYAIHSTYIPMGAICIIDSRFGRASLNDGLAYYTDRDYTLTSVPSAYLGMDAILTPNDDRNLTEASDYLSFEMPYDGTVYVAYDSRATSLPTWMSGFSDTGETLATSLSTQPALNIYNQTYRQGDCVNFGANKASGFAGATISNYLVFMQEITAAPPVISGQPGSITVEEGQNATFTIDATGAGPLHYQWHRDSLNVGENSPVFTISDCRFTDSGSEVSCSVSNGFGITTSATAILTVTLPSPCVPLDSRFVQASFSNGLAYYTDRDYTLTSVPSEYLGMDAILTPNDDRNLTDAGDYLSLEMPYDGTVYVAYDSRATSLPTWMNGFSDTDDRIYTSLSTQPDLKVYQRSYSAGACVNLGANKAPGFSGGTVSNYIVFYGPHGVPPSCILDSRFVETILGNGLAYYTDRAYTLTGVPSQYVGMEAIITPNDDLSLTDASGYLTFEIPAAGTVYVAFDRRVATLPHWLSGFVDTGSDIQTSLSTQEHLDVYSKSYSAGECVNLGGNHAPDASSEYRSNYIVFYQ